MVDFGNRRTGLVEAFTSSVTVDRRLYAEDIQGSIAHCKTLEKARALTSKRDPDHRAGLEAVKTELDRGRFKFVPPGRRHSHGG